MKKLSIIIGLLLFSVAGFSQSADLRRKIEVNGTAEKEVTPDIINVSVSLKNIWMAKRSYLSARWKNSWKTR